MFLGPRCGPEIFSPLKAPEFLVEKVNSRVLHRKHTTIISGNVREKMSEQEARKSNRDSTKVKAGGAFYDHIWNLWSVAEAW